MEQYVVCVLSLTRRYYFCAKVISIWRGSIAERSGVRIGHRIIELNGTSTVGMAHEELVHMLSTTVGDVSFSIGI